MRYTYMPDRRFARADADRGFRSIGLALAELSVVFTEYVARKLSDRDGTLPQVYVVIGFVRPRGIEDSCR
jgi:hypothetical protein